MKNLKYFPTVLSFALVFICLQVSVSGQTIEDRTRIATMTGGGLNVRWDVSAAHSELTLTVSAPDGQVIRKEFQGSVAELSLINSKGERLPDGQYTYELRLTPAFSSSVKETLKAARAKGNEDEVQRDLRKRGLLPSELVQSGGFLVMNGSVIVAGMLEEGPSQVAQAAPKPATPFRSNSRFSLVPARRNHAAPSLFFFDQVIPDDLIVQGSACVGLDCVNNENFGFDTIRLKENNDRIQFDDTSSSAGFATNNWQIRANNSASGGASFLSFVDQGAAGNSETGTIVFEVDAGAPANSIKVGSNGKVGFRTATPVLDLHANTSDTPAIRLEQNNSGGFTAQTWDIGANEANFFIRDVTGGSRLSLRIRPGAPTSSLDISSDGDTGVGTASPLTRLDVRSDQIANPGVMSIANLDGSRYLSMYSGRTDNNGAGLIVDANQSMRFGTGDIAGAVSFTEFARFTTAGRLGIGTAAPDSPLTVNGAASKPGGGSWSVFSDNRLKTIKGTFNSGLSAVMKLQPIRYEYRANNALGIESKGEHVGFSAQEVQRVVPEAVTQTDRGFLMVNNDPIIWTMLNAIKEQQKEIQELKQQIKQLRGTSRRRR
jgi:hypothetical protein